MSFIMTLAVFVIAALLLVAYARKMQEGGFTPEELRSVRARAVWVVVLIVILAIVASSVVVVPVGSRMVVYNLMTRGFRTPLSPGFGLVLPLINERHMYDVRTQEYTMSAIVQEGQIARADSIEVLSSDGLKIGLDITILFHADPMGLNDLHATVGPDYVNTIIRPTVREAIRTEFAQYEAMEAVSTSREVLAEKLTARLGTALQLYEVVLNEDGVKLRNIVLPPTVENAIEEKKAAQQEAERMQYVLAKERQEKERVQIEAEAQAARIKIVNDALAQNPNYLNWLAIDKLNENIELVISDGRTILNLDAMRAQ